jgi:hypothetical protein
LQFFAKGVFSEPRNQMASPKISNVSGIRAVDFHHPLIYVESPMFFIDTEGDGSSKKLDTNAPRVISLMANAQLLNKDPLTTERIESMPSSPRLRKVNVISDDFRRESDKEEADGSEEDEDDEIFYLGRNKPLVADDSDSDSEVSDYIRNAAENGDDYMTDDLARMHIEGASSGLDDDGDFADLAAGSFLLRRSPSTLMESSLDMDAAQFLNDMKRAGKQKRTKGKGHLEKKKGRQPAEVDDFDPFRYDGPYTVGGINFRQINREMKMFLNDDVESELEMDPMPPLPRKFLHELAHLYGLKSKSSGQGRDRHCVLYKTERSSIPRNVKHVSDLIQRADKAVLWMDKTVTKGQKFTAASVPGKVKEARKGKKGASNKGSPGGMSAKPQVGTVVGQDAAPLDESNLGNKMLQKLGWKPGQSLGAAGSEGIVDPLTAVVRGRRTGLGA